MVSTHLKNISQIGSSPQVGMKMKNNWNHHLDKGPLGKNKITVKTRWNFHTIGFPPFEGTISPKALSPFDIWSWGPFGFWYIGWLSGWWFFEPTHLIKNAQSSKLDSMKPQVSGWKFRKKQNELPPPSFYITSGEVCGRCVCWLSERTFLGEILAESW